MRMKHDKAEMQKAEYLNQALALCHYVFAVWENTPQLAYATDTWSSFHFLHTLPLNLCSTWILNKSVYDVSLSCMLGWNFSMFRENRCCLSVLGRDLSCSFWPYVLRIPYSQKQLGPGMPWWMMFLAIPTSRCYTEKSPIFECLILGHLCLSLLHKISSSLVMPFICTG